MKANTIIKSKEKQMNYSTYRLSFPDGTFYVGSTSNTNKRFLNHKHSCKNKTHYNHKLQTAWNTFGNPDLQILNYYTTREEAFEAEQEILNEFYGTDECLNLSSNAKSVLFTEESRMMSRSVEARKKMSATHKGKTISTEHRARISSFQKDKPKSTEHRAKLSASSVRKISIIVGTNIFSSITEASKYFQVSQPAITNAVKRGSFRGMKVEKVVGVPLTTQR